MKAESLCIAPKPRLGHRAGADADDAIWGARRHLVVNYSSRARCGTPLKQCRMTDDGVPIRQGRRRRRRQHRRRNGGAMTSPKMATRRLRHRRLRRR